MNTAELLRKCARLPSRMALLLGLGAVSVGGAAANVPEAQPEGGTAASAIGAVTVRAEGGRIYLREAGRESELRLGPTPQREHLLRLLEPHGRAGVRLEGDPRLIMSGGGGAGFTLRDLTKSLPGRPAPDTASTPPASVPQASPKKEPQPRDPSPAAAKKG